MKKLVRSALVFIAALIAVIVAIANRHGVTFVLDPFSPQAPFLSIDAPLFSIIFAAVFIGMLIGGAAVWMSGRKFRKKARVFKKQINLLVKEKGKEKNTAPPASSLPALPEPRSD